MRFHIENMNCGGCARSVTKTVESEGRRRSRHEDGDSRILRIDRLHLQGARQRRLSRVSGVTADRRPAGNHRRGGTVSTRKDI